jgi:hypothetical protein
VPKLVSPEWIDDHVIRCTDRDDLAEILSNAINRATELAAQHKLASPIALILTDAEPRCLLTMTMNCGESGWASQIAPGEVDKPGGIAFPWFLLMEDDLGKKLSIRIELDSSSRPM